MKLPSERAFGELVGDFYRAVAEPEHWPEVAKRLLLSFGGSTGAIMVADRAGQLDLLGMPGFSERSQQLYSSHFYTHDPWAAAARQTPNRPFLDEDIVPADVYEASEFWNDFARIENGAFHLVGALTPIADGVFAGVGLNRLRDQRPFDEEDRRHLGRLLPHLQAALRLRQSMVAGVDGRALGSVVLDALDLGVIVARADGTLAFVNAAALASRAIQFGPSHRPVAAADPAGGRRLLWLIRDAAGGGPGGAVVLGEPGGPGLAALVARLPPALAVENGDGRGLALVVLRPLDAGRPAMADTLRQLFGLTLAEAELALALFAGERPDEVAASRCVRISTVRSQLRAILDKTGTRRQSDLMRLLARLAPFRDGLG